MLTHSAPTALLYIPTPNYAYLILTLIFHSTNLLSLCFLSHCFLSQIPFSLSLEMEQKEILVSEILLRIPFLHSQCHFRFGYRFKPIWGDHRRRSKFANSKSQSHPQIPILNLKRKRDYEFACSQI